MVWSSSLTSYLDASIIEITTSTRTWFQGSFGTGNLRVCSLVMKIEKENS